MMLHARRSLTSRLVLRFATASRLAAGVTIIGMTCPALQPQREASKRRRRD
jgi:hypothetical protein